MLEIALASYLFSLLFYFFVMFSGGGRQNRGALYYILPTAFILAEALYVLPLSVRSIFTLEAEGNISQYLPDFVEYIPLSLVLCALFNFSFLFFYRFVRLKFKSVSPVSKQQINKFPILAAIALLAASLLMLHQFAADVGGVMNLILLGYKVTEKLSAASHYAIAFDWLVAVSIAILYSGYVGKSRSRTIIGISLIVVLFVMFLIMGRRGVLVVLIGSALLGYHVSVKRISKLTILISIAALFILLNFVGLTRGESYRDISDVVAVTADRGDQFKNASGGLLYTITNGNFVIPFETFPQIISGFGDKFPPGFGAYSLRALTFVVPSSIWEDRPLPLSNWYMSEFYGESEKNVGRQFFFLTSSYMDFGPFGVLIFGFAIAFLFRLIVNYSMVKQGDPLVGAFFVLFLGSMLNMVSNDLLSFVIVFLKTSGIPLIILYVVRAFSKVRAG